MRILIAGIVFSGFFWYGAGAFAQMSSTNFEIQWDTVGAGGGETSESASYILRDTTGTPGIGDSESASYSLSAGYRQGVHDTFVDFSFFSQNSAVAETATALVGTTIMCDPTDFSVGDMVALVQDVGATQVAAIGEIVSLGAGSITVDRLTDGGTSPAVDGTNDTVYLLSGVSADLGDMEASTVSTSIIGFEVSTDASGGYVVQMVTDGNLRDGSNAIDGVSDGSVTAGVEEYGARSADTSIAGSTFDTADTALSTSFQDVADRSSPASQERGFITLKGSVDGSTPNGSYAQQIQLIVSGAY